MTSILITEKSENVSNLEYIKSSLLEVFNQTGSILSIENNNGRAILNIDCNEYYLNTVRAEIFDKVAEIIAINYKYDYFKNTIKVTGLNETENEILLASLIAADLEGDKKYALSKLKAFTDIAIDGIFNFRLLELKLKWKDIASYMPDIFINSQLKDFITFLLENKNEKVYIDGGAVYDSHYKRLKRCSLLGGEGVEIIREVLLSNCGEVELSGEVPKDDEMYLKEFYGDKVFFTTGYFS